MSDRTFVKVVLVCLIIHFILMVGVKLDEYVDRKEALESPGMTMPLLPGYCYSSTGLRWDPETDERWQWDGENWIRLEMDPDTTPGDSMNGGAR